MGTAQLRTALPLLCALALLGCNAKAQNAKFVPHSEVVALPGLMFSQQDEIRDIQACVNQAGEMQVVVQAAVFVGQSSGYHRSALVFWTEDKTNSTGYRVTELVPEHANQPTLLRGHTSLRILYSTGQTIRLLTTLDEGRTWRDTVVYSLPPESRIVSMTAHAYGDRAAQVLYITAPFRASGAQQGPLSGASSLRLDGETAGAPIQLITFNGIASQSSRPLLMGTSRELLAPIVFGVGRPSAGATTVGGRVAAPPLHVAATIDSGRTWFRHKSSTGTLQETHDLPSTSAIAGTLIGKRKLLVLYGPSIRLSEEVEASAWVTSVIRGARPDFVSRRSPVATATCGERSWFAWIDTRHRPEPGPEDLLNKGESAMSDVYLASVAVGQGRPQVLDEQRLSLSGSSVSCVTVLCAEDEVTVLWGGRRRVGSDQREFGAAAEVFQMRVREHDH